MSDNKINKIKNILSNTQWHNNIINELNPNTAFNNLTTTIQQTIDFIAPKHVVLWMTKGLIKSCQTKINYYEKQCCPIVLKQTMIDINNIEINITF